MWVGTEECINKASELRMMQLVVVVPTDNTLPFRLVMAPTTEAAVALLFSFSSPPERSMHFKTNRKECEATSHHTMLSCVTSTLVHLYSVLMPHVLQMSSNEYSKIAGHFCTSVRTSTPPYLQTTKRALCLSPKLHLLTTTHTPTNWCIYSTCQMFWLARTFGNEGHILRCGNKFWRFTANMASTSTTGGTGGGKDNGGGGKDESGRGKRARDHQVAPLSASYKWIL
ncbi:hypothetical protein E2C01_025528 [Portunus trituberculatus]|uniref:Uncharacterized protein n=1 Tax=Portunus trituberculatus TaxID=210409 RepID=A0A5B7EDJ8_PORTR|nr:hypothetical protein [Portunus trituberculatus]